MKYRLTLIFALLGTSSAVAKAPKPLSLPVAPTLPVEIVLAQKDGLTVRPMVNPLSGAYTGALVTAIEDMQGKASVKANMPRLQEIRDRVTTYDFDRKMEAALRAVLASGRLSHNPQIEVVPKAWTDEEALSKTADSDGVYLRIVPFYGFDAFFNSLEVSFMVTAIRVARNASGKVHEEHLFGRDNAFFTTMPEHRWKVSNSSAWRWQRVSDDDLLAAMDEGIAQSTAMLAYDISPEGQAEFAQDRKWQKFLICHTRYNGTVARTADGLTWYRQGGISLIAERPVVLGPPLSPQ